MTSGFQGSIVQKQIAFESQSSAGLLPPVSSDHECEEEDTPQPAQSGPSRDDMLPSETIPQNNIATIPSDSGDDSDILTELELKVIDDAVDRDLDPDQGSSALILWEDIRVSSRKTKKFAEAVLRNTEEATTASSPAAVDGPPPRNPSLIGNQAPNPALTTRSTREGAPDVASSTRGSSSLILDAVSMPPVSSSTTAPPPSTLEAPDIAQESMERSSDIRTLQGSDPREQETTTLEIPGGDLFEIPFEKLRSWEVKTSLSSSFTLPADQK